LPQPFAVTEIVRRPSGRIGEAAQQGERARTL
jgi:hypothetical protein